jgi:hypothetical protein
VRDERGQPASERVSKGDSQLLMAARRGPAWLPHRSRPAFRWEIAGYRWEVSHGVVRCWIVPFSRDLARLRQRRGTRPELPVVAAAEDGFGYRDRGDRRAVEVAVGQVAVTVEDQRQMVAHVASLPTLAVMNVLGDVFRRGRLAADRDGLGHAAIEGVEIVLDTLRRLAACVARPGAGFVFRIPSLTVPMDPSSK